MNKALVVTLGTIGLSALIGPCSIARAADSPVLSMSASAVDLDAPGRVQAGNIQIVIERWSTDAERQQLQDALVERGSDRLLTTLQKISPRAGFIKGAGGLGWDIQYARREQDEATGVRRIIFATDRPMSQREVVNKPRSSEYEFTLGEIRISSGGKGEGKLVTAAKVKYEPSRRVIEIENYGTEPVRLNDVRVDKGSR